MVSPPYGCKGLEQMAKKIVREEAGSAVIDAGVAEEGMDVHTQAAPADPEDLSDVTSHSPAEPMDITTRLTLALERLASKQEQTEKAGGVGDAAILAMIGTLAAAVEKLTEGQLKGSELIANATKKATRPSNEAPPQISCFNPRGDKDFPKPQLKCQMLLPWPAEPESLTREETELLNLLEPGDYVIARNDRTKVKMSVRCTYNLDSDKPSKLIINHDTAFNNDYHRMMPPMTEYLRSMLKQNPKSRQAEKLVVTDDDELLLIAAGQLNDGSIPENGSRVISIGE